MSGERLPLRRHVAWPADMAACASETCPEGANCERRWGGILAKREARVQQVWMQAEEEPCGELIPLGERVPVVSSNIASIGYDADEQTLVVEFKGGRLYRYADVPKETHQALMRADSVGGYFARHIKGAHPCERIEVGDG